MLTRLEEFILNRIPASPLYGDAVQELGHNWQFIVGVVVGVLLCWAL